MPAATSMVASPSAFGVNIAVYTVLEVGEKLLKAPLDTVISSSAKSVVAPLDVKVSVSVASLDMTPSATSAAEMVMARGTSALQEAP